MRRCIIFKIKGINHITFSVSDLEKSIEFYQNVFGAKILVRGEKLAYFDLNGLWIALNEENNIPRKEIYKSYTHIGFSIDEKDYKKLQNKLKELNVNIIEGRKRKKEEGKSIYFRDPDGHLFELHTKDRTDRINFYKNNRNDLEYFD
jgi:metallothiol transferase